MKKRLTRNFYIQPTLKVAKEFLDKYIVRKIGKKKLVGKIIETEAYIGPQDRASHAFGGKRTPRNRAEYMVGGHIYIYLVYGMYWQLNISTYLSGKPECVLIRAIEPVLYDSKNPKSQLPISNKISNPKIRISKLFKIANGPGKVCRYLKLDKSFYGEDLTKSKRIWLEEGSERVKPSQIIATKRIGIDYAGPYWSKKKLRFLIRDYSKYLAKCKK